MTIFERRNVTADGITLYYISPYQELHHLRTKHTFIYATRREKERRRKREGKKEKERRKEGEREKKIPREIWITGKKIMRKNRYI